MTSTPTIRPSALGWLGLVLALIAVAMVQWFGGWGYFVAVPAFALLLYGLFAMHREAR